MSIMTPSEKENSLSGKKNRVLLLKLQSGKRTTRERGYGPVMERQQFRNLVGNGKIFRVEFIKRTDGLPRIMLARVGVKADGGGELNYNPKDHELATVFDMQKLAWRNIPLDNIYRMKASGVEYRIRGSIVTKLPENTSSLSNLVVGQDV